MATEERDLQVEGARTQNLFREVNERVSELNEGRPVDGELLCECADKRCVEPIALTWDEYERIRRVPTHFFVVPGHELGEIERVLERNDRYAVVEKIGAGGAMAARLDPRTRETNAA